MLAISISMDALPVPMLNQVSPGGHLYYKIHGTLACQPQGRLLDANTKQLQGLPGWKWSKRTAWVDMHAELVKWFYAGNDPRAAGSRVQDSFPSRGTVLGKWVHNQRYAYRHGQLAQPRVHALEALPAWTWKPAAPEAATPQQLAQRRQYKSWPRGSLAAASASVAPMDLD